MKVEPKKATKKLLLKKMEERQVENVSGRVIELPFNAYPSQQQPYSQIADAEEEYLNDMAALVHDAEAVRSTESLMTYMNYLGRKVESLQSLHESPLARKLHENLKDLVKLGRAGIKNAAQETNHLEIVKKIHATEVV